MTEKERLLAEMERERLALELAAESSSATLNLFPTSAPPPGYKLWDEPEDFRKH